jgi:predicted ATPase/class 3 adenylate cyclase
VAELHVVSNDFLSDLDWQVTGDAVRFQMIFFADNEAQECLQPLAFAPLKYRSRWYARVHSVHSGRSLPVAVSSWVLKRSPTIRKSRCVFRRPDQLGGWPCRSIPCNAALAWRRSETPAAAWCGRSGLFGRAAANDSSSSAEFGERLRHERTRKPGMTASPNQQSSENRAAVILTPDQRVRVFISSTLEELAKERAAALRAIRRLHLVPVWFESGARPHPPQSMYRAYLEQSQIFVGIYWQRYGWVGPGMEISGLEDEFRLAAGMPMLLYLKHPAPHQEPGLSAMIDSVRAAGTASYRRFETARELERLLSDDLAVLLSETFADATLHLGVLGRSQDIEVPARAGLPAGTITFLLTDIEGSARLWENNPEAMELALQRHDGLLAELIEGHGGSVVTSRGEGDSVFAVFPSAVSAVEAAGMCQLALRREVWPTDMALRVRMGLHTGEARVRGGDHVDYTPINRCARVRAAAHGGQVLLTKTTRDLVAGRLGGGFGLQRLGEFRLRDLTGPELIFQLTHPDLPADFPPLHTLAERTGNLPLQVSTFIGRTSELEQTKAALGEARLVTLTGTGGVGKTRLALQAAGQMSLRFADGAWLCDLTPLRDPAGVDAAVAAVFSVTAPAGQSTRDALAEFLRSKELLLVLDNCEHLLEGAAALANVLQRSCDRLAILATSREGLGIEGERLVPVPPLAVPGADADLAAIAQADAVRLFADRAAAVKPEFAVTVENASAVAAVVRRLDGIALAIELAAARIAAMTPSELAHRLERSFVVLGAGRRGVVAHHQTLRATIDWSYQLLAEPEQALLARLSVFAGGCTLEAVETVCGGDTIDPEIVLELLASLVARSLVVPEDHGPETRYRLLETIRQYGEERLTETGETDRWQARHADYYVGVLQQIRRHDRREEVFWAVRLNAEQDNLLAAWSWAIDTGNVAAAFSILAGFAPCEIWSSYRLLLNGEAALELPGAAAHPGYPLALAVSAVFVSSRADVTVTDELCRQAAEANARQEAHDWRVEEVICGARSNLAFSAGAFAEAARLAEQAAAIARTGGDLADASIQLNFAASNYLLIGDAPRAVPLARDALTLARQIGAPALIATGLLAVGGTVAQTDPEQARACLHESLELSTALGYQGPLDLVLAVGIAFILNDGTATLELGRSAIHALQRGGDRLSMNSILHVIAGTLAATQPEAAAIIQGAAEAYMAESPAVALLISFVTEALGEERARELRARGADMDWDQAVAYTLAQTTQALNQLKSGTQP